MPHQGVAHQITAPTAASGDFKPGVAAPGQVRGGGRIGRAERRQNRLDRFQQRAVRREQRQADRRLGLAESELAGREQTERFRIEREEEAGKVQARAATTSGAIQLASAVPQAFLTHKLLSDALATPATTTIQGVTAPGTAIAPTGETIAAGGVFQPSTTAVSSGATGGLATAGAFALPAAAGFGASRMIGGANKETKIGAGFVAGAITGAAYGSVAGPFGIIGGAIVGGVMGAAGGSCIIVTACTDPHSHEVEISREFRDKYLGPVTLRGYYIIAEKLVPVIKKHGWVKKIVKRVLVDSLVDYGEFMLEKKDTKPRLTSTVITESFLWCCKAAGQSKPVLFRNMEVL